MPAIGYKRARPGRRRSIRQVLDLQEGAHEMAMGLRVNFKAASDSDERARVASAYANIGKMWCTAQDSKREILGKPKAGVLKQDHQKTRRILCWEPQPWKPVEAPREAPVESNTPEADLPKPVA